MRKTMLYLKRTIISLIIAVIFIAISGISLAYIYQDKIIQHFVIEANKYLQAKVQVKKITFSVIEKFPQVAIRFDDIIINESYKNSDKALLNAHRIYFTFDIWDIINGKYNLHKVYISKGNICIRLNPEGIPNYNIIKKDTTELSNKKISFDLRKIIIEEIDVVYENEQQNQTYSLYSHLSEATLKHTSTNVAISLDGKLTVHKVQLADKQYFKNKKIDLKCAFLYTNAKNQLSIKPSSLRIEKSEFLIEGDINTGTNANINLTIQGINTNIQTILSLLSKDIYDKISIYKSKGDVYFKGKIVGPITGLHQPNVEVLFGCQNVSFYHPSLKKELNKTSFNGSFSNESGNNKIEISTFHAFLDNRKITGELTLKNFRDPELNFVINADLNIASIIEFFPIKGLAYAKGEMNIDLEFKGKLNDLKTDEGKKNINTSGEISVNKLEFKIESKPYLFSNFTANLLFNKNDVSINQFSGRVGNTDFALGGFFKNVIPFIFFKEEKIIVDANCKSTFIDLDELLANSKQSEMDTSNYKFAISPRLELDLTCNIDHLKFRKFNTGNLKGDLKLNNRIVSTRKTSFNIAGGNIELSANLNTSNLDQMNFKANTKFNNIIVDSVFYMFENFDQKFITAQNLRGRLTSKIDIDFDFNKNLKIDEKSLKADINLLLQNGQLLNFEPMQKLSKFIDAEELKNISFKEIKNDFHIENSQITIPEMIIRSNLNTISVSGTHSFDNKMDYRLKVTLKNFKKKNTTEEINALEEDKIRGTTLFLKIIGIPPNIKISYDTKAVREKIKERLKDEKTEIKKLFQKRNIIEDQKKQPKVEVDENNIIDLD